LTAEEQFKLRQATVADIPAMSSIRLSVRENILSDPARVTEQMYYDYLDALGRGWVVESHGKILGFSYAASKDSSIWALFVSPEYEGRGLGARLLASAVDWLFELGNETVQLSTAANTRADKFYCAQGWARHAAEGEKDVRYQLRRPKTK
jgi:GNAT superfamily N-acetyltransferase